MSEEKTKNLTPDEKLDKILADLAFVKSGVLSMNSDLSAMKTELVTLKSDFGTRLARLEAFAEDKSRDTRPMLDRIHKNVADLTVEVVEVKSELMRLNRKWEVLNDDVMEVRVFNRDLNRRLDKIESQTV